MRIVLSIVIISIIYIWRNTQITTPIIIDDSPTILQNSQTIQNKLKEIGKIEILNVEYQNDYKASLQTIELLKNNNCFYATGYWTNFIYEFRFTEIYWLRRDEMVKLYSTYNINDTTIWNSRREQIIKANSWCN